MAEQEFTKFEKAAIIGARALQLAYGAPPLVKVEKDIVNPLDLAEKEFENNAIPITILR